MGTEESNRSATSYKILITQDETLDKPFPPHLSAPIQVYHNSGSAATPFINSYTASFSLHPNIWANQEYSTPLQYDSQHDPRSLSSHLVVSEDNLTRKQQCDVVLPNGDAAEKEAIEKFNTVHVNRNSALEDIAVKSTELNANLETASNIIGANPGLSTLEEDEIRKERKRQLNRESARRSRIRKQRELEELQSTVDNLMSENSFLKKKLMSISEDCVELTDLNDSIEKELVEMYGPDLIADLIATKAASMSC